MKRHPGADAARVVTRAAAILLILLVFAFFALTAKPATAQSRIFPLHLENGTGQSVSFRIVGGSCWEGSPRSGTLGPVAPGAKVTLTIARIQGHGCDGEQGYVAVEPSTHRGELQWFWFSNDGGLAMISISNDYVGLLSPKSPVDESYTWTLRDIGERLMAPPDERLTKPRNPVAYDSGYWARVDGPSTATVDTLQFVNQSPNWGSYYFSCGAPFSVEMYHPQHVQRLTNKNGRAYFMVAQSRAHNGWIYLMETYPGVVDPETDLLRPNPDGSPVGRIIWQDLYTGSFNGNINPIGNWNHPAKMTVQGGILIVVAQNWSEDKGLDGCTGSTGNPYQRGNSEDALLFYDVRDPEHPKYWGKMTATELGLPKTEYFNGTDGSGRGGYAAQIDVVSLTRSTTTDEWTLNAGYTDPYYVTWRTSSISPNIEDWTKIAGYGTDKPAIYTSGEHGDDFTSYQWDSNRNVTDPANGIERNMTFDAANIGAGGGEADGFEFGGGGGAVADRYNMGLPGADRDWAADSIHITRDGMPIVYSVESAAGPDGSRGGDSAILFQVHDTRNLPATQTPHPVFSVVTNTNDAGPGSLRRAIGYGGTITFDPSLSGQTITLSSGPLVIYVNDVVIDGSALADGITISGHPSKPGRVFQIEPGVNVTLSHLTIANGYAQRAPNADANSAVSELAFYSGAGGGILNRGDLRLVGSTVANNRADVYGGGIANSGGSLTLVNATVAQNESLSLLGGGVMNYGNGTLTVRHSTIADNKSTYSTGGLANATQNGLTLEHSIIAGNTSVGAASDLSGNYHAVGTNIVEAVVYGAALSGPTVLSVDPGLQPLGDYGGPTQTMEPGPDSPAINAAAATDIGGDQRLFPRPIGAAADLGAVERLIAEMSPTQDQAHVLLRGVSLAWSAAPGAQYELFFDNGTGQLTSQGLLTQTSFALPEPLAPDTEYRWRVDYKFLSGTVVGDEMYFRTRGELIVTTALDENDPGLGLGAGDSLREIIAAADPGDTATFAAALSGQTIRLNGTQLEINKSITVDASALPDGITINGASQSRVFNVQSAGNVTLKKLTITGGNADTGGGIRSNNTNLTIDEGAIRGNRATDAGGGIYNAGGTLNVARTTLEGNEATNKGGGIYHHPSAGGVSIDRVTLAANGADEGAGIYYNGAGSAPLNITRSTFDNQSAYAGGGIFINGGAALVENSTLAGNTAANDDGAGIRSEGGATVTLRHVTVIANVGAGVVNNPGANLTLENSIVANNFDSTNQPLDVVGAFTAVAANLVRAHDGTLQGGTAPLTDDPALEDLRGYGGSTRTMAPLPGSPVINAAVANADTPSSDQRGGGHPRPRGAAPDLGAVESSLSSNADLIELTTSVGQLEPAFLPGVIEYTIRVPYAVTSAAVRATRDRGGSTMQARANGGAYTTLADGEISPDYALTGDASATNTVEIKVTAEDGVTTQTYTLSLVRDPADASLTGLATSAGALTPSFDPATLTYATTVANGVTETTVTPTSADPNATIRIIGEYDAFEHTLTSGATSPALPLHVGCNHIIVKVTSADGTVTDYLLEINRTAPPEANADLAGLTTSAGSLNSAFTPGVGYYTVRVGRDVSSVNLTANAAQPGATIAMKVGDGSYNTVASGAASPVNLAAGANTVAIKVTAQDGITVKVYTVVISRVVVTLDWIAQTATYSAISSDGRFVAFSSSAADLVDGDTNNKQDVFVYDVAQQTVERVSVNNNGVQGDFDSTQPDISADGRYVTFWSEAQNLVPGDSNGNVSRSAGRDVFVYDRQTDTIERVSLTENGGQSNQASDSPSISGDGRYVAFVSRANNLISGFVTGDGGNVYIHDRDTDTLVGIVVPFDLRANRDSLNPDFSTDGTYVAFEFNVSKNVEAGNDDYKYRDIYLYNRETLTVQRLTGSLVGKNADGTDSRNPSISADGRYVAFESNLARLDFYDTNRVDDVFVYDRVTARTTRVSVNAAGAENAFPNESVNPAISGDGRYVVFESRGTTLVTPDANERVDIFKKNLQTGEVELVSVGENGVQADDSSSKPAISYDGQSVVFHTSADNLSGSGDGLYVSITQGVTGPSPADLAALTTSAGGINPCFHPAAITYHATVANDVASASIKAVTVDPDATMTLHTNGASVLADVTDAAQAATVPLASGIASAPLPLSVGDNAMALEVTASDGNATKTYALTIHRTASNNAKLANLVLVANEAIPLTPAFAGNTTRYAATVPEAIAALSVAPTAAHTGAIITVNGADVASGSESQAISLNVGSNTITVRVTAEDGTTTETYEVTVTRTANQAPVAYGQSITARQDTELPILLNGADADGDPLTFTVDSQPTNGAFIQTTPVLIYKPNPGFAGADSFTFKAGDGVNSSPAATVAIDVRPNRLPVAVDDSVSVAQRTAISITVLANDYDQDEDFLAVSLAGTPSNGTATVSGSQIRYTPNGAFLGQDSFGYAVDDGKGGTSRATVTVFVYDPTVANQQPVAADDEAETEPGAAVTIDVLANDRDGDGDALTLTLGTQPRNGTAAISQGTIVYTPNAGFAGVDTFTYTVNDGRGGSATATVTVKVGDVGSVPVNVFLPIAVAP